MSVFEYVLVLRGEKLERYTSTVNRDLYFHIPFL